MTETSQTLLTSKIIPSESIKKLQIASDFAYRLYQNKQEACETLLQQYPLDTGLTASDIQHLIDHFIQNNTSDTSLTETDVMRDLRQLRNLLMFRWIWQDALTLITLEQLTEELSDFADACLVFAKNYTFKKLTKRYGEPRFKVKTGNNQHIYQADDLAIFAMGKLGAKELNQSSDIDLIFVYQARGNTDTTGYDAAKSIETQQFMQRLGQGIIKLLDTNTADGFVFRVDMRLRPWGEGSDLTIHQTALQKYFVQHGRAWERFAWLKARVVNPIHPTFTTSLHHIVQPFVFRHYVDYSAFAALREMRSMITNQVAQREDLTNIKLGAGGIRDIEFIVQAYQLIYGGRHPALQVKSCLKAMLALHQAGYFNQLVYTNLRQAYYFLRRLEHGIQAMNDQQTQRLPTNLNIQKRIALSLAFANWQDLVNMLNTHRHNVSVPFDDFVTDRQESHLDYVNNTQLDINQQLNSLLNDDNQQRQQQFWQSKLVLNLSKEVRQRLDTAYHLLAQALIQHEKNTGKANVAFPRLIRLLESICRRSVYLVMLAENPQATIDLIPMLSASPWIANELAQYPVLLDTFLQQKYHHLPEDVNYKSELTDMMRQRLLRVEPGDEETLLSVLRLFKKIHVLAVAGSDILAERPIMQVSNSLTHIAEVVLEATLQRAFCELVRRHGYPLSITGEPVTEVNCGFAIIGYGKLGGLELSYSSDLDLVFLHNIQETALTTNDVAGTKPISGMKFAQRLAQKLMTYLTSKTRDGDCYEIDMRLRPSGNAGMMVVSDHAFERYQAEKAWVWEHQALVRARAICGDNVVMQHFNTIRHNILIQPRDYANLQAEVVKMRQKMRQHLGSDDETQQAGNFHLKQDSGGMVDIEFMAQFAVLAHAHQHPQITAWSDNVRIFSSIAKMGIWQQTICDDLTEAYLTIRTATHQLALAQQDILVKEDEANHHWHNIRQLVQEYWQTQLSLSRL